MIRMSDESGSDIGWTAPVANKAALLYILGAVPENAKIIVHSYGGRETAELEKAEFFDFENELHLHGKKL